MATIPTATPRDVDYPSGDGKPLAETPTHRDVLLGTIEMLRKHFANDPTVYVSGNMFVYYVRGDKRRHVSPDVFVVRGVPEKARRDYYLVWEEGKGPEFVVEMTSLSTRDEDLEDKMTLYQDTLRVQEYFLFDPFEEYLEPSLRGFRLVEGHYVPIEPVAGRLPSEVVGLHLERNGTDLRLYNPATGRWIPTDAEALVEARRQTEAAQFQGEAARLQAEVARQQAQAIRQQVEAFRLESEAARLQAEAARQQAQAIRKQAEENERRIAAAMQQAQESERRIAEALRQAEADPLKAIEQIQQLRNEVEALRRRLAGES